MSEISKQRQNYLDDLKSAIESGDHDKLSDLLRNKDTYAIRNDLSTALGEHVNKNYDEPLNIFEKKDLLKEVPVNYTNLPEGIAGRHSKEAGIYLPFENPDMPARQTGVKLHEYGHANDALNNFNESNPFDKSSKLLKNSGLENAEELIGKHHEVGMFEKEALANLLKNKKLAMVAPLLKATGIGAIGASAVGIGNKAMAGDFKGAAGDTADLATDLTPIVGEAKLALSPTELGNSELPPEIMEKQERFNKLKQKLNNQ